MPTYQLITSNTLTTSTLSVVTLSNIPGTYTDLLLKTSLRSTNPSGTVDFQYNLKINGVETNRSYTFMFGYGAGTASGGGTLGDLGYEPGALVTTNTFSNDEFYFPNYTVSANKPFSLFNVVENNGAAFMVQAIAALWRSTAAITSLTISDPSGGKFIAGSSFFLYGIKNS